MSTLAQYLNCNFTLAQTLDYFLRILVSCLCGACIGLERSRRFKEAGIRTHVIVCCASALMMIISKYGFTDLITSEGLLEGIKAADGARIAAQVVTGISFLGAGVIFRSNSGVKGLTTAAGIWATAGIGLAIGAGMYVMGIFTTVIIFILQVVMHKFTVGTDSLATNNLQFVVLNREAFQLRLSEFIIQHRVQILESKVSFDRDGHAVYDMVVRTPHGTTMQDLLGFFDPDDVQSIDCMPVA